MRILLTNDDGIEAPGLAALRAAAAVLGGDIVIVAPAECHSGCGHRVTTERAIRVDELSPGRFRVAGTPADCVRIGLAQLVPDAALVLSGINAGGNLGADIHHSGTVAAAREAALHGRPAVAASHYHRREEPIDWRRAAAWMEAVLADVLPMPLADGEFWNVNFPHPLGLSGTAARPPLVALRVPRPGLPPGRPALPAGRDAAVLRRFASRPRGAGARVLRGARRAPAARGPGDARGDAARVR